MTLDQLQLHPKQYLRLDEPMKFYINSKITPSQFDIIKETLAARRSPLVISGKLRRKKNETYWAYDLQMPTYSLVVSETDIERCNLACNRFDQGDNGVNKYYNSRYLQMFLLEAAEGIYLIYKQTPYFIPPGGVGFEGVVESEPIDWGLETGTYKALINQMHSYFGDDDEYAMTEHVSPAMNDNVMMPFDQYTQKEHDYETQKVDFTKGVVYESCEVGSVSKGKKSTYTFFSRDKNADPEASVLSVGNQLTIYTKEETHTGLVGLLVDVDTETRDGVQFTLEFYQQFDRQQLPDTGYLFVHQNDTQMKIRNAVSKSIRGGRTPAKYMYQTFKDFSTKGYEEPEDHPHLTDFLKSQLGRQYPPNKMQLEAIVKGVLTEDALLVLGPPGTGKTTVILAWVEYYLSQGKRVLISSQNNAAVDNVLERCNENLEIVRLGREEKVQENCKKFLPDNRIQMMRNACETNSKRVESSIQNDLAQIDAYCTVLKELEVALNVQEALTTKFENLSEALQNQAAKIRDCHKSISDAKKELNRCQSQAARYEIFIEQSMQKNWLVRFFQVPLRNRAKIKIKSYQATIEQNSALVEKKQELYDRALDQLADLAKELRSTNVVRELAEARNNSKHLNDILFWGTDSAPRLLPDFNSELKFLDEADEDVYFSLDEPMESRDLIYTELDRMSRINAAAEKILAASAAWVDAVMKDDRNDIFQEILLEACQVVGATCIGINSNKQFSSVDFDVTIIDESGQIQLHNALVPMSRSPKTLMLGDYKQIPPIVNEEIATSCRLEQIPTHLFEQSFFEFLFEQMRRREIRFLVDNPYRLDVDADELPEDEEAKKQLLTEYAKAKILKPVAEDYIEKPDSETYIDENGEEKEKYFCRYSNEKLAELVQTIIQDRKKIVNLNSQFRMPGNISDVISEWFYESNYFSSYNMKNFKPVVPGTTLPMVIINTGDSKNRFESQPPSKMGYQNDCEAKLVADVLEAVLASKSEEDQLKYRKELSANLGVISAYGAQVRHIRQTLRDRLQFTEAQAYTAVASLDSFQGQERDLIIYSLTRSTNYKSPEAARVGFLKELRRLNVAFTRCKKQLVIIGDLDYLQQCLYVPADTDRETLPCAGTDDAQIGKLHIDQCADCKLDCERRFARFFRLLMQHATQEENPAGNLYTTEELKTILAGGEPRDL